jgi:putative ABC transport system permease protein
MTERVLSDVRYALRSLSRSPGFTAAAVLSLALAIGMNVAVFSVVNTLFFEGLPVRDSERLVELTLGNQERGGGAFTYPMFERIRDDQSVLGNAFGWTSGRVSVQFGDEAERLPMAEVTDNYYQVLGITAAAGRLIGADHAQPANAAVAVLSHRFWRQRFGGRPDALGETIRVEGLPMTIIGIEPAWFEGLDVGNSPDIIVPVAAEPLLRPAWDRLNDRGSIWLRIFGYMPPDMSLTQVRAGLRTISPAVMRNVMPERYVDDAEHREEFLGKPLGAELASTGVSNLRDRFASPLATVMIMVGILFAIATANVANLFVSRALARRQESAIRLAIGASPWDVVRQFMVDSLMLAAMAAVLGIFIARWAVTALVALMSPPDAPIRVEFAIDATLMAFTIGVAFVAALVLGGGAASRVRHASLTTNLQDGGRGGSRSRLRLGLVCVQVALSTLLLIGAGLFMRTLLNLRHTELGFSSRDIVLIRLDPKRTGLKDVRLADLYAQLAPKIAAAAGVRSAGLISHSPLGGDRWNNRVTVDSAGGPISEDVLFSRVSPNYFATVGSSFVLGRDVSDRDTAAAPPVVVVNQAFTRKFFGKAPPIGSFIRIGDDREAGQHEVVGVVKDSKFRSLRDEAQPLVYVPYQQAAANLNEMTVAVRVEPGAAGTTAAIRRLLNNEAPNLAFHLRTMTSQIDGTLVRERMLAGLALAFAVMAAALAALGLYGIIAHLVVSRTREIGLHMALGATAGRVVWRLVRGLLMLVGISMVIGGGAAVALARWINSLLFDVKPADPLTLATVAAFIVLVAITAGMAPARRAARIDPAVALRRP